MRVAFFSSKFILACGLFFASISANGQECSQLFQPEKKWAAISLDYAPVVETPNGVRSFPDSVLIEAEDLLTGSPPRQWLVPYIDPVTNVTAPYGRHLLHEVGLKAIYQNYGDRVATFLVDVVIKIESSLTLDRQSTLLITDRNRGNGISAVEGFLRIFDGSVYTGGIRSLTRLRLPLELILAKFGKSTTAINAARDAGFAVFEVGKYFLNSTLSGPQITFVRRHMMRWMIGFLETRGTNELERSVYFAHVASRAHFIAYQRGFGFKEVPSDQTSGLGTDEHILQIRGIDFLKALKDRLQE